MTDKYFVNREERYEKIKEETHTIFFHPRDLIQQPGASSKNPNTFWVVIIDTRLGAITAVYIGRCNRGNREVTAGQYIIIPGVAAAGASSDVCI